MTSKEEIVGIVNEGIEKGEIEAGGTEVIANPTLAGTESALTGLQVGDTKYKVEGGGGSGKFLHEFILHYSTFNMIISIVKTDDVKFTNETFATYLSENGYNSQSNPLRVFPISSYDFDVNGNVISFKSPQGVYRNSDIGVYLVYSSSTLTFELSDGVLSLTKKSLPTSTTYITIRNPDTIGWYRITSL